MNGCRIGQCCRSEVSLVQCRLGTMQLQVGKDESKMHLPIVGPQLQRHLEILDRFSALTQIVPDEAAVHVSGGVLVDRKRAGEVCLSFSRMSGVRVHVTSNQRQIPVLW